MNLRRALISVYDKTGIVDFARALHDEFRIEIISTGGTARTLRDAGVPVTLVEDITGCGEMLDGRVKTLHPKVHAAILADRDNPDHVRQLAEAGIEPIDIVVVNLYPFEKTVADPECTFERAIEMIDIGGVALLRAAAKNHKHVLVPTIPDDLERIVVWLREKTLSKLSWESVRRDYASSAFEITSRYDAAIETWLTGKRAGAIHYRRWPLRYGENPHQDGFAGGFAGDEMDMDPGGMFGPPTRRRPLSTAECTAAGDVELSYNNYLDADAALGLCAELSRELCRSEEECGTGVPAGGSEEGCGTGVPAGGFEEGCGTGVPAGGFEEGCGTGVPAGGSEEGCGTGVPAGGFERSSGPFSRVSDERYSRRNLPHIQKPERTYFVTFRTHRHMLHSEARTIVLEACRHWHARKMNLCIAAVMPDHVHLLLTPFMNKQGESISLAELLHSIKGYSAHQIVKRCGLKAPIWLDESWDRMMRDQKEFEETWSYIETNPERAGLGSSYPWVWSSQSGFEEAGVVDEAVRRTAARAAGNTGGDAGATPSHTGGDAGATPGHTGGDAGATPSHTGGDAGATPSCRSVVFIKHTNACGVGVHGSPFEAYRQAYLGDPNAAMGGILAVDFPVDAGVAAAVLETYDRLGRPLRDAGAPYAPGGFFVEVWLAPYFTPDAVRIIRGTYDPATAAPEPGEPAIEQPPKKDWGRRVRLLAVGPLDAPPRSREQLVRSIDGGLLLQSPDTKGLCEDEWKVVTKRQPDERELSDARLAWLVCKHTKSNAITVVRDGALLGNGAGQMSRVMSCRIATWLARENGHADALAGAVAASDAFFPFPDGPQILIDAGVTTLIQPGGGKRDAEVIAACDARGVAMILTGTRHFRH